MTVYVDELRRYPTRIRCFRDGSCHLTADTLEELHELAQRIGLRRAWFQTSASGVPHYDLTPSRRGAALVAGAVFVPAREQALQRLAWKRGRSIRARRVAGGVSLRKLAEAAKLTRVRLGEIERGVGVRASREELRCIELGLDAAGAPVHATLPDPSTSPLLTLADRVLGRERES